ncbi:MAG: hypothetical protein ACYTGW_00105 [Planctomycetota bacterium]
MDPATPDLTPRTPPRAAHRDELDPLDRRLTAGLLAVLLGFIVGIGTWTVIWPRYRDGTAPTPDAVANGEWPTTEVILWSLLVLALWVPLWIGVFYWALSRRRRA